MDDFTRTETVLQIGVPPRRIDLLMDLAPGLRFEEAWATRVVASFGDLPVPVLSREFLIRAKLAAGRPQDIVDVQRLEAAIAAEGQPSTSPRRSPRGRSRRTKRPGG